MNASPRPFGGPTCRSAWLFLLFVFGWAADIPRNDDLPVAWDCRSLARCSGLQRARPPDPSCTCCALCLPSAGQAFAVGWVICLFLEAISASLSVFWCDACLAILWSRRIRRLPGRRLPAICPQSSSVRGHTLLSIWPVAGVGNTGKKACAVFALHADVLCEHAHPCIPRDSRAESRTRTTNV